VVITAGELRTRVAAVPDPELPWVTIEDLGVLRELRLEGNRAVVEITPTWSGCPAMDAIRESIRLVLDEAGLRPDQIQINTRYSPAWTTDDINAVGRRKLAQAGIAPPRTPADHPSGLTVCPLCQSSEVRQVSEFGSTPCKALMACNRCLEPFDRFKEL
jgi:ring-1,2-phenylacetyl-CoA epoxidase subunit PaaD